MNRKIVPFLLVLSLLVALPAAATLYVPMRDETLVRQADLIARVRIEAPGRTTESGSLETEYVARVDRVLKGGFDDRTLTFRVPGGERADVGLKVWGAPGFAAGEEALLFLAANEDGTYSPLHLMLGAFHVVDDGARKLAVRDLSEAVKVGGDGEEEGLRDLERFSDWVAARAAGKAPRADYRVSAEAKSLRSAQEKFTLLRNPANNTAGRWFVFDNGGTVGWRTSGTMPNYPGGGIVEFQEALASWTDDPSTAVKLAYLGATNAARGFEDRDNVNAILFGDPRQNIGGTYSCSADDEEASGTLAAGGSWYKTNRTRTFGGQRFYEYAESDIITQDGMDCNFTGVRAGNPRARPFLVRLYVHELGHTLGLGHSCGDGASGPCDTAQKNEAIMKASIVPYTTFADRGGALEVDDRLGIAALYSKGAGGTAAPSNLTGTQRSRTEVELQWTDNSNNETRFLVERKNGKKWVQAGLAKANATGFVVKNLAAGKSHTFRVRAKARSGNSEPSNEVTVTLN
jgi:hypothetical protein